MKGLEKITQRIRSDAQAEIDAILAEGDARAAEITANYREQARTMAQQEEQRSRQDAEALVERRISGNTMDKGKALLGAKQECIDEAFARAAKKLRELPAEEYAALLARIAAAAGVGDEELIFSAADAEAVGEAVVQQANALKAGASFTLGSEHRELDGGVVLKRGDVEVNCGFATQLRLLRQTMAADVAAILFH